MQVQVSLVPRTLTFAFVIILSLGAASASVAQDIPANAHRNTARYGWECDRGYSRVGYEGRPVAVPANASLGILC